MAYPSNFSCIPSNIFCSLKHFLSSNLKSVSLWVMRLLSNKFTLKSWRKQNTRAEPHAHIMREIYLLFLSYVLYFLRPSWKAFSSAAPPFFSQPFSTCVHCLKAILGPGSELLCGIIGKSPHYIRCKAYTLIFSVKVRCMFGTFGTCPTHNRLWMPRSLWILLRPYMGFGSL